MILELFSSREQEIFRTLKELKEHDFVIIGGYAVNAYTLPRFSVDCDIVIRDDAEWIENTLLKMAYKKIKIPKDTQYSGYFSRYEKRLANTFNVSMDILIKQVIDRETKARFDAEWIFNNSELRELKGKTIIENIKLRIINIDALLVLKIISCRPTDIRDVFMLITNAKNNDWIRSEISKRCSFKDRMDKLIEKIDSRQFKDGLSGVYGRFDVKAFEKSKRAIMILADNG